MQNKLGLSCAKLRLILANQLSKFCSTKPAIQNRSNFYVLVPLGSYMLQNKNSLEGGCVGVPGVLDQMKVSLTLPQVELGLSVETDR
jgi:hypothetical protein